MPSNIVFPALIPQKRTPRCIPGTSYSAGAHDQRTHPGAPRKCAKARFVHRAGREPSSRSGHGKSFRPIAQDGETGGRDRRREKKRHARGRARPRGTVCDVKWATSCVDGEPYAATPNYGALSLGPARGHVQDRNGRGFCGRRETGVLRGTETDGPPVGRMRRHEGFVGHAASWSQVGPI